MLHAVNATRLTLFRHQARRNLGTAFAKGLRCARNRRNGRGWSHGIQVMRSFRQLLVLSACRCLRQQAILVARVPDRPCWRSFRVDKNNSAHEEARCDECAPGLSLECCGDRRSTRPLCPFRRSYDDRAGGSLATHNSDCVAKWRPWLGNRAVHFLIPPDRKVVVFQNQPKLLVQL